MTAPGLYLIFRLDEQEFAIQSEYVREILLLPQVTRLREVPHWVAGVMDIRGQMVPIIDLHIRLDRSAKPYRLTDAVAVIQNGVTAVGIIVNEVKEVSFLSEEQLRPVPVGNRDTNDQLIAGLAATAQGIVTILSAEQLVQHSLQQVKGRLALNAAGETILSPNNLFPMEDHSIFASRAEMLRQSGDNADQRALAPVAVIRLDNEYFGVPLDLIREFLDQKRIIPVPGAPSHVTGLINLRGEVLGIVNIREFLSLVAAEQENAPKIMVIQDGEFRVGIIIHEISQIMYLDLSNTPEEMGGGVDNDRPFVQRAVQYGNGMMLILNLKALIQSGVLEVNQEI